MSLEQGQPDKKKISPERRELQEHVLRLQKRVRDVQDNPDGND